MKARGETGTRRGCWWEMVETKRCTWSKLRLCLGSGRDGTSGRQMGEEEEPRFRCDSDRCASQNWGRRAEQAVTCHVKSELLVR